MEDDTKQLSLEEVKKLTPEAIKCQISQKVQRVLQKAEKCGLSAVQIGKLEGYKKLDKRRRRRKRKEDAEEGGARLLSVLGGIVSVTVAILVYYGLFTHAGFSRLYLKWLDLDLYSEQCTLLMPDYLQYVFRPPVDCSMCENVTQVDRLPHIDVTTFEERYAYTGRPVVVTDGAKNWPAINSFSLDFFKKIYEEESLVLKTELSTIKNCQFFPYQTEFEKLQDVFNMTAERNKQPWYIGWSNCDATANNILRQYYSLPYFLPKDTESSVIDWIFMGSSGYGAHMHIDRVGSPSWQAQIMGTKKWFLQPPPECYMSCRSMEVTVYPGEIIVLDTDRWFHATLIVSDEMSITIGSEYD